MLQWAIGRVSAFPPAALGKLFPPSHLPPSVKRRFNDFISLNKDITLRYARTPLPSLPGRRWFGSLSPDTVRARHAPHAPLPAVAAARPPASGCSRS